MKKTFEIAFVYIGLVIGAGFASGREILEYFNNSSQKDFSGIILSALCFAFISYIIMCGSSRADTKDFDTFVDITAGSFSPFIKIFMFLFMFCGLFVMMAGSGALLSNAFGVHSRFGIILLTVICFVIFSFDLRGLVAINSVMVPVMIIGMTALCIVSALTDTAHVFAFAGNLRHNPLVSSVCYASYNTITAGAVLVPLAYQTKKKVLVRSAIISSSVLGFLIFLIWTVQNLYYSKIQSSEMPLFDLAVMQGRLWELTYTAILFMALCTTAIAHGFGILSKFRLKSASDRVLASASLCVCAMPFARIGFSDLVANLYFIFGLVGIIWLIMLIHSYLK